MRNPKPSFRRSEPTRRAARSDQPASSLRSDAFLARTMRLFGDAVYRVALAQTGSPADADDVYQDVFLRLLKDATAFASDEHLKAWLLRVTVNRCHDLARTAWKRRTEPLEREHADILAPNAFRADIWEVVAKLPEDQRAVVHLFYIEGYSTDEIARIMQCQPATVRTRLHRARQHLKADLDAGETEAAAQDFRTRANSGKEQTDDREPRTAELQRLPLDDGGNPCPRPSAT